MAVHSRTRRTCTALVALLICVAISYWGWRRYSRWQQSVAAIEIAGGSVSARTPDEELRRFINPPRSPGSVRTSDVAVTFRDSADFSPDVFETIGNLPDLGTLSLSKKSFAPEDLAGLTAATNLESLYLYDTSTNDESLTYLKELRRLEFLGLARTQVTDRGLAELVHLPKLTYLSLNELPITDAGVKHLCRMSTLTELEIVRTEISDDGLQRLRDALPECKIIQ